MTVSSTVNTSPIYAGNDTTGPWAFGFKTFDQAELEVTKADSGGIETILTLTTHYTVSLNGDQNANPGGEVTTVANVATGESLRVRWVGVPTQETDIQNAGGFYPEVIENALDKLTMLTQRNTEEIGRAVKTTITSGDDPDALVASLLTAEVNAAASESAAAASESAAAASESAAAASAASIVPTSFVKRDGTQGMQGLLQLDYSTDIASGATVDLGTATGNSVTVTHSSGTTAITSFGGAATAQKGTIVAVIPSISGGTLTVTHHATNMILLGGANITLASGDVLLMMKNHDSNAEWKHIGGWRANGAMWVPTALQAEMEAGTEAGLRSMSPLRVAQAIAALGGSGITLGTAQATTSGTAIDFTGLPAGTKLIYINFVGVSFSGTSAPLVQIGDSGGPETTGYSAAIGFVAASSAAGTLATSGFQFGYSSGHAAAAVYNGTMVLVLENAANFTWSAHGTVARTDTVVVNNVGGSKSLSAELDRVRITTAGGADTFDAGEINISYMG